MSNERNLTPAQAAALLGVSGSTLRRWSVDYGDRLSEAARPAPGRKRNYTPDDLATLQRARDLLKAGKPPAEVGALLGVAPEAAQPTGGALVTLPRLATDLQQAIDLIRQQAIEIARLREAQEATAHAHEQEIAGLRDEQEKQAQQHAADLERIKAEHAQALSNTRRDVANAIEGQGKHHAGALATAQAEQAQAIDNTRREVARMFERQAQARKKQEAEIAGLLAEIDRVKAEQAAARRSWLDRLLGRQPKTRPGGPGAAP